MHILREAAMAAANCKASNSHYPDRGWRYFWVMPPRLTVGYLAFLGTISSDVPTVDEGHSDLSIKP